MGGIDGADQFLSGAQPNELPSDFFCDPILGFDRRRPQMRRANAFRIRRQFQQRFGIRRFLSENVQTGAGALAALQRLQKIRFVNYSAPGAIYQINTTFAFFIQNFGVDHV